MPWQFILPGAFLLGEPTARPLSRFRINVGFLYDAIMDLDAKVCYCFHITWRKLVNFVRLFQPKVPSQLSECGGAGTGCGWCIPFLKQIHQAGTSDSSVEWEQLTPEEYAQRRAAYIRAGKGTPPPGATPLPPEKAPDGQRGSG
jgi:bacterioferritin-associated ferredoxin